MDDTYIVKINRERTIISWAKEKFPHLAINSEQFETIVRKGIKTARKSDYEQIGKVWTDEDEEYNEELISPNRQGLNWRLNNEYGEYGGSYGESYSGNQPYGGQDPFFQ